MESVAEAQLDVDDLEDAAAHPSPSAHCTALEVYVAACEEVCNAVMGLLLEAGWHLPSRLVGSYITYYLTHRMRITKVYHDTLSPELSEARDRLAFACMNAGNEGRAAAVMAAACASVAARFGAQSTELASEMVKLAQVVSHTPLPSPVPL